MTSSSPTLLPTSSPTYHPTKKNIGPMVGKHISPQYAIVGKLFDFIVPKETFVDPDSDEVLTLSATRLEDTELPSWLSFFPRTWKFLGNPKMDDIDELKIEITASDSSGDKISEVFFLVVKEKEQTLLTPSPLIKSTEDRFKGQTSRPDTEIMNQVFMVVSAVLFLGCCFAVCVGVYYLGKCHNDRVSDAGYQKPGIELGNQKNNQDDVIETDVKNNTHRFQNEKETLNTSNDKNEGGNFID